MKTPRFSIVISTLNRGQSLRNTLESFQWLQFDGDFEVVVVNGPSTDHTQDVLREYQDRIRVGTCAVANISVSRNIGICMARGDIIAFIDDDAIPEPEWLAQLAAGFDSPEVGAVGGFVFDHTGYSYQYRFCMADRLGNANPDCASPTPQFSFPGSCEVPHLLGTNSAFRRDLLLKIGGFDEEFEYYLDETDVCFRLIDAGYAILQLSGAYVHHKFARSDLRDVARILRNRFPVIKNKIYFSLKHGRSHYSLEEVLKNNHLFIQKYRDEVEGLIREGKVSTAERESFSDQVERAWDVGLRRGLSGVAELMPSAKIAVHAGEFLPFTVLVTETPRLTVVLISSDYPPGHRGGIATFTKNLAQALAGLGHTVHVIAQSHDVNRVDFESGVWVHRMTVGEYEKSSQAVALGVSQPIWNWSAAALTEVKRIAAHRKISIIEAPVWDCEGIAVLLDGSWPLVTSLHTTLRLWLRGHPELGGDTPWMKQFGGPMLVLEQVLMTRAHGIRANSRAITRDIEDLYGFTIPKDRLLTIPHGMNRATVSAKARSQSGVEVLFVGRLEQRKGIDVLLAAIPQVCAQAPEVFFRIVGDGTLVNETGLTYEQAFRREPGAAACLDRVRFEGKVDDAVLAEAYAACDLFVGPSRYESLGLIFLEAMRFGKPVIGCDVGGVPEIITPEVNGLLVPPNDVGALTQAIVRLVRDPVLRERMGRQGRDIFQERFTAERMARASLTLYEMACQHYTHGS